jgi:hypothetical protein
MEYTVELAEALLGKRVIVSLRHVSRDREDTYSGLWGIVDSVYEDGILLRVEGGVEDEFWMMPPDLNGIKPAAHEFYQMGDDAPIVEDVDFEAYWCVADDPDLLQQDAAPGGAPCA